MRAWRICVVAFAVLLSVAAGTVARESETAVLGGGCFWCLEAAFEVIEGVTDVVSGYAGGQLNDPTYESVCSGRSGHAEVVQVRFDPKRLSYAELLTMFFELHDPTTRDRQGPDVGSQYRSIILTRDARQGRIARSAVQTLQERLGPDRIVTTQVQPLTTFYLAEPYHQDYYRRHPEAPYCQRVISPKVNRARSLQRGHGQRRRDNNPLGSRVDASTCAGSAHRSAAASAVWSCSPSRSSSCPCRSHPA